MLALLGVGPAMACTPPPVATWHPRLLAESPVIFAGIVTEVVGPQGDLARISVTRTWRGKADGTVLLGEQGAASCRPRRFRLGEQLVFFADRPLEPGTNRIGMFRILDSPIANPQLRAGLEALGR